jgi:hypothetical protein
MIKLENTNVYGWEAAIRGMRNPMNSWEKSDSEWDWVEDPSPINPNDPGFTYVVGPVDHDLMMRLAKAGSVDAKYRRMLTVIADITAPLYWWKEFDTYKVGTVANSCSTMHKIAAKEFTMDDFSHEHLAELPVKSGGLINYAVIFEVVIAALNSAREMYLETKDKVHWWQMIQMLPSSYNQRRTVQLNYEVLAGIYPKRKDHKLDEWHDFCDWIKSLPYSELITLEVEV